MELLPFGLDVVWNKRSGLEAWQISAKSRAGAHSQTFLLIDSLTPFPLLHLIARRRRRRVINLARVFPGKQR